MKFCVRHTDLNTDTKADEIIFRLNPDSNLINFVEYVRKLPDKKILLQYSGTRGFSKEDEIEVENFIKTVNSEFDISVLISRDSSSAALKAFLKEHNIPFFYYEILYDQMELLNVINDGVSEVYIHGALAFQLKSISEMKSRVKVRVFVDAPVLSDAESNLIKTIPEKMFWVRPEDVVIYSTYVDTFEIAYRPQVKLDIYKRGIWEGRVRDLIPATEIEVFNNTIPPTFASMRINCRWKCGFDKCNICDRCIEFAKQLSEKGLELKENKDD